MRTRSSPYADYIPKYTHEWKMHPQHFLVSTAKIVFVWVTIIIARAPEGKVRQVIVLLDFDYNYYIYNYIYIPC